VTLHEVYDQFPGVFPRERITGGGALLKIKRFCYDKRHPLQTIFRNHCKSNFHADKVLVHYPYQIAIVKTWGIAGENIVCIALPAPEIAPDDFAQTPPRPMLHLGSAGFINPNFDYQTLFAVLDTLPMQWRFTWIGGVRRPEDQSLLDAICATVRAKNWPDKFKITGWVEESDQARQIGELDIYCAFFTARSASSSLMLAIANRRCIVAADLPLVRAINAAYPVIAAGAGAELLAKAIVALSADQKARARLIDGCDKYAREHSYSALAKTILAQYQSVIRRRLS
ncbi:MAG: hypothetical protein PHC61_16090, partial [Chitinivibrionales bacterium]|nr:hypothetical protein [Chitinivibrionales bacterium]